MRGLALLSAVLAAPAAYAASASDWQSRSIYQVVTDRFATSDNSSPSCDTSARKYCGGTWKGIMNKLDYIQDMGFDALWISPVAKNVEGNTAEGEAFHGYWTQDPTSLNSHFGSDDDLKALSDALHKRGMYLMLDVVINHLASASDPPSFTSYPSPFNAQSAFHPENFIQQTDYPSPPYSNGNQTAVEQGWLGDKNLPLADINTEDPNIVSFWYNWISNLVKTYSADGVRIDTVKHIRQDFWTGFKDSAGVWCVGEVLANETVYVGPYTKFLPAVLDYPTWFSLVSGFLNPAGNLSALAETFKDTQSTYGNGSYSPNVLASFLENQDQPRFGGQTNDQSLIKNAMTWPFVQDGTPIMYYGQEQGYTGGADPANREALWLSGYDTSKPLVKHARVMNAARKAAASANNQFYTTPLKFLTVTQSQIAVSKPPMLALLTNQGSSATTTWNVGAAGFQPNQQLIDVVSCTTVTTDGSGAIKVNSPGGNPMVFLPASSFNSSICLSNSTGSSNQKSSAVAVSADWQMWTSVATALSVAALVGKLVL